MFSVPLPDGSSLPFARYRQGLFKSISLLPNAELSLTGSHGDIRATLLVSSPRPGLPEKDR